LHGGESSELDVSIMLHGANRRKKNERPKRRKKRKGGGPLGQEFDGNNDWVPKSQERKWGKIKRKWRIGKKSLGGLSEKSPSNALILNKKKKKKESRRQGQNAKQETRAN